MIPFFGHEALRSALLGTIRKHELPATLLIHGGPGCGKQSLALWLAQARLCNGDSTPPCGSCQSCRFANRLEHPDVHWYFPLPRPKGTASPEKLADALDGARYERLAEYRENPLRPSGDREVRGLYLAQVLRIRRAAQQRPSTGEEQIFVIGDAEYLVPQEASPEAANALLKLLEEPPDGSRFILTSSRPESLLATIRSRALAIHLPPLAETDVAQFLEAHASASPTDAGDAARLGMGSIGMALGHLEQSGPLREEMANALGLLRVALAGSHAGMYAAALGYGPAGARGLLDQFAGLQNWIRDLSAVALGRHDQVINQGELPYLKQAAARLEVTPHIAALAIDQVEEARILAEANVNPQLLVSSLLLDLNRTFLERPLV